MPDDQNTRALLVHRRLSIIDLQTGQQPMGLRDDLTWIVFNGEIYNHPDLRSDLSRSGIQFRTRSDTEVILQVYKRWGVRGLGRLNGIFAVAIYDAVQNRLLLARDPVGVKPLYWSQNGLGVAFSSEIRPLLTGGFARRVPSISGLTNFLYYRFVPAPGSVLEDVHKIPPGHALEFRSDCSLAGETDFTNDPPPLATGRGMADLLAPALQTAVRGQMLADVPVGAFLSGGLDSSLVVASLGERSRGLSTFAIGFPDSPGQPSELRAAKQAADILGCVHEGIEVAGQQYFERLRWAIDRVEEPVAHPGMLLQADLAAAARRRVKVVLTGQGADEPLGGYPRHHAARVLPFLGDIVGGRIGSALASWVGGETGERIKRALEAPPGLRRASALFSPLTSQQALDLVRGTRSFDAHEVVISPLRPWWDRAEGRDDLARLMYLDVRTSLAEDLLLVADKMSMSHSLEARVPYLDLNYLAVVEALPGPSRIHLFGRRKAIQHALARRILPAPLAKSLRHSSSPFRRKRGFDVPVAEWFRGPFSPELASFLTGPESVSPQFLDATRVNRIVASFVMGSGPAYRQVLALYTLEVWLRSVVAGKS